MGESDRSGEINRELSTYLTSKKRSSGRFAGLKAEKGEDAKKSFEESEIEVVEGRRGIVVQQIVKNLSKLFKKEKKVEPEEEEIEIKDTEKEEEQEPTESEEEELEKLPKRQSFIKRLLLKIGVIREDVDKEFIDEYEDEVETLDEDISEMKEELKAIAKITTDVMSKLPRDELDKFKSSDEFLKFKEILKKYDLIK